MSVYLLEPTPDVPGAYRVRYVGTDVRLIGRAWYGQTPESYPRAGGPVRATAWTDENGNPVEGSELLANLRKALHQHLYPPPARKDGPWSKRLPIDPRNPRPLTYAELIALAAVAQCDSVEVISANQDRESRGLGMAYDGCQSDARDRLVVELKRRGVLK